MKWASVAIVLAFAGFSLADVYTFRDGYYWNGGRAYNRHQYYQQPYVYNGCYHAGYHYYKYEPVYVQPQQQTLDYRNQNWRSDLLGLMAQRDKFIGQERANIQEHKYFMDALKFAGLEGNFRWENYGAYPYYGSSLQLSQNGVLGNTIYGYKYTDVASLFGDNDPQQLYQMAARLAEGAQKYAGDGTQNFMSLVDQNATNRLKAAEILAKGQAAAQALKALADPASVTVSKSLEVKSSSPSVVAAAAADPIKAKRDAVIATKCKDCHGQKRTDGGLDMLAFDSFDNQKRLTIFNRLTTPDVDKLMPRKPGGGPGERLSQEEVALFLQPKKE